MRRKRCRKGYGSFWLHDLRQLYLATQCGRGEADWHLAGQIGAVAMEYLVRIDSYFDIEVAMRASVSASLALS